MVGNQMNVDKIDVKIEGKNTLETSGEDVKTTLGTGGKDVNYTRNE